LAAEHRGTPHAPKYDWMLSLVERVEEYYRELMDAGADQAEG
jgi:hypothetical protein